MRGRLAIFHALGLVLLICLLDLAPAAAIAAAPIHFTDAQVLSEESSGYSPPPYVLDADRLAGTWRFVALPHAVRPHRMETMLHGHKTDTTTVIEWYRIHVPTLNEASAPLYLYIPRSNADGQLAVYGDGRLIYQSNAGMPWNGWNIPLLIPLNITADTAVPKEFVLRLQRPHVSGGGISTIWLGDKASIDWRYRLRELIQVQVPYMSSAAFLAVGFFSFFVWLRSRDQFLYFWFSLVSLTSYLRAVHFYVGLERFPVPMDFFSWLTINSLFWKIATVHFFLNYLHQRPQQWLNRAVTTTAITMGIFTLPFFAALPGVYAVGALAYVILLIMGITVAVVGLRNSMAENSRYGILLAGWGLLGMGFGIYDWLLQNDFIGVEGVFLGPYSNVLAFLIFSYIMNDRYVAAMEEVREANTMLEERLRARESELTQSHLALREIEKQQTLAQERRRLMQDMHDGLGSSLVSALRVVEHGRLDKDGIAQLLKDCIDDLRLAIDSMEPVDADLLLLLATLRFRIAHRLEATGIQLKWEVKEVPPLDWLMPQHSLHILRILQEAFTNVVKHAEAKIIRVKTASEDGEVIVSVHDDGRGFDVSNSVGVRGKGMANLISRAEGIGGRVKWESDAQGTKFFLWLPISSRSHRNQERETESTKPTLDCIEHVL